MNPRPTEFVFTRKFWQPGDFAGMHEAERYLAERGFSVGPQQGNENRGIFYGATNYVIRKWRSLDAKERAAVHGILAGNMRDGPVSILIFPSAPREALEAFNRKMAVAEEADDE
jgi:hypothetical protein